MPEVSTKKQGSFQRRLFQYRHDPNNSSINLLKFLVYFVFFLSHHKAETNSDPSMIYELGQVEQKNEVFVFKNTTDRVTGEIISFWSIITPLGQAKNVQYIKVIDGIKSNPPNFFRTGFRLKGEPLNLKRPERDLNELKWENGLIFENSTNLPFTGIAHHQFHGIGERFEFKNGKLNGTQFHVNLGNGRIIWKYIFLDGKPHGDYSWYYQSGKICIQGEFFLGCKSGIWAQYDQMGLLIEKLYFINDEPLGLPVFHDTFDITKNPSVSFDEIGYLMYHLKSRALKLK